MAFKSDAHRRWWFANRASGASSGGGGSLGGHAAALALANSSEAALERQRLKEDYFTLSTGEYASGAERKQAKEDYFTLSTGGESSASRSGLTLGAAARQDEKDAYFDRLLDDQQFDRQAAYWRSE